MNTSAPQNETPAGLKTDLPETSTIAAHLGPSTLTSCTTLIHPQKRRKNLPRVPTKSAQPPPHFEPPCRNRSKATKFRRLAGSLRPRKPRGRTRHTQAHAPHTTHRGSQRIIWFGHDFTSSEALRGNPQSTVPTGSLHEGDGFIGSWAKANCTAEEVHELTSPETVQDATSSIHAGVHAVCTLQSAFVTSREMKKGRLATFPARKHA